MRRSAVTSVRPTARERVAAWLRAYGFAVRATGLVAIGVGLGVGSWAFFPLTEDGSFSRELVNAGLGALVTVVAAAAVAMLSLWRELRARREAAVLRRFEQRSWARTSLTVGRMSIPDVVVVASCTGGTEWTDRAGFEFTEPVAPRPAAPELPELRRRRLEPARVQAEEQGVTLTDDPCVDLRSVVVRQRPTPSGRRQPFYELRPAVASYADFVATTSELDQPWTRDDGAATTLREHWAADPVSLGDVGALPAMAKVGVGTAVVTADDRLVLGVRGRTFVAGRQDASDGRASVHVVAEGMVPGDLDRHGRLDPRETARRGRYEELALGGLHDGLGRVESLKATSFLFDQDRWQPCFAFLARTDATWDELQSLAPAAGDYW